MDSPTAAAQRLQETLEALERAAQDPAERHRVTEKLTRRRARKVVPPRRGQFLAGLQREG